MNNRLILIKIEATLQFFFLTTKTIKFFILTIHIHATLRVVRPSEVQIYFGMKYNRVQ